MRAILFFVLASLGMLLLTFVATLVLPLQWTDVYYSVTVFLLLLSITSHEINLRSIGQQGRAVMIPYITSTVIKLFLASAFLIAIVWFNRALVFELVIVFLVQYATISVVEIILVARRTRGEKF